MRSLKDLSNFVQARANAYQDNILREAAQLLAALDRDPEIAKMYTSEAMASRNQSSETK